MRVVVALGGNTLAPRGAASTVEVQRQTLRGVASLLAEVAAEHELVITHGSGPQVGLAALQAAALDPVNDFGLDVLDAEAAGLIGYLIEEELSNHLPSDRWLVTLLTRVVVDHDDPAFASPSKFVGPSVDARTAHRQTVDHGWRFDIDGDHIRRVVASPQPRAVLSAKPVRLLLDHGYVVVCGGGGGIPVIERGRSLVGVEAVVDKDATSALLAERIHADLLVLATDVDAVYEHWGSPQARPRAVFDVARHSVTDIAAGSMRPKVEAAARFAATGGVAVIGTVKELPELVAGRSGTRIVDPVRSRLNASWTP